jgi:hypothetical protein
LAGADHAAQVNGRPGLAARGHQSPLTAIAHPRQKSIGLRLLCWRGQDEFLTCFAMSAQFPACENETRNGFSIAHYACLSTRQF